MPSAEKKKQHLANFGKNRKEVKIAPTQYDAEGNWVNNQQHQSTMRTITNKQFDKYYAEVQQLGQLEAERRATDATEVTNGDAVSAKALWEKEMEHFRTPLNTTVWVNDTDPLAGEVRAFFEKQDASLVQPIPWYPVEGMGWRILADKTAFRKRPDMKELRQFLIRQTALGTISRQEEVSMIPPFLLNIQPNDVCLDMCASPGSKTAQMLCALGRHKVVPFDSDASPFPFDYESDGLVMANELDSKRANMLVHQVKRLRLLFPFALFTNHDARFFPDVPLDLSLPPSHPLPVVSEQQGDGAPLVQPPLMRFDKILCDVVCSGDGTLRKAPHVFKIWSPKEGMSLQKTQVQIAMRACHLLKVGGRLVYSTCSLNPIENEAVVAQLIHRTNGAMKLVDVRQQLLPNLVCAKGMKTWTVTDFRGNVVEAPGQMHEAFFPPNTPGGYSSPAVNSCDLSLCLRLFPSHCDGGGFFIAVLDKVSEFRMRKRTVVNDDEEGDGSKTETANADDGNDDAAPVPTSASGSKRTREKKPSASMQSATGEKVDGGDSSSSSSSGKEPLLKKPKVVPPQFVPAPEEIRSVLSDFYDIKGDFSFPIDQVVMRTANGEREARMTPSSACTIVARTARRILAQKSDSLVVVSAGLRLFAFETLNKGWRIASESAVLFAKLMQNSSRLLTVPVSLVEDLIRMGGKLKEKAIEDIADDAIRHRVESLSLGAVLLRVMAPAAVGGELYSVALRARTRLQLLVDHEDLVGLQLRLGLEPVEEASCANLDVPTDPR